MNAVIYNSVPADTQSISDIRSLNLRLKRKSWIHWRKETKKHTPVCFNLYIIKNIYIYIYILYITLHYLTTTLNNFIINIISRAITLNCCELKSNAFLEINIFLSQVDTDLPHYQEIESSSKLHFLEWKEALKS